MEHVQLTPHRSFFRKNAYKKNFFATLSPIMESAITFFCKKNLFIRKFKVLCFEKYQTSLSFFLLNPLKLASKKFSKKVLIFHRCQRVKENTHYLILVYLKGRYFRGKKISRISRFLLKSAKLNSRENFQNRASTKLNSREIFQNWVFSKLKIINVK